MSGSESVTLGPFTGGMHNSSGKEFINDDELYDLTNLEVDTDGSLVNRPPVGEIAWTLGTSKAGVRVIGTFLPSDGRRFLVLMTSGTIRLMDLATNTITLSSSTSGLTNACVVQYRNRLFVAPGPTDTSGNGGYFEALPSTAPTWTTTAAIPSGGAIFLYKERLWVVAGSQATTNISRIKFSAVADGTTWSGSDFIDIYDNNGEKLVYGLVLANDIVLFKQRSTYRLTYDTTPARANVIPVSSYVGTLSENCAVLYDNSNVYILSGDQVYEMYNYTFNRISDKVDMSQIVDASLYGDMVYSLGIYRDRLFVRYYANLYSYNLRTYTWSRWSTVNKFSRLVTIPAAAVGLDVAYGASATSDKSGAIFFIRDSRVLNVGTAEVYNCSVVSKAYDFDAPNMFKRIWYWGMTIATSGLTTASAILPNTAKGPTWADWALKTWADLASTSTTWGAAGDIAYTDSLPSDKGGYARKYYRFPRRFRLKRVYFTVTTEAKTNNVDSSSVRIYNLLVQLRKAETVTEKVN